MSRTVFRAPLWAWAAALVFFTLFCTLGTWQVSRGQQKLELQARMDQAQNAEPQQLRVGSVAPQPKLPLHAGARGHYDSGHQLLLDNQSHAGRPGYHVWTPLQLESGGVVIVNRGWLPQSPDGKQLPPIEVGESPREVRGLWRPLPQPGLRLAQASNCSGSGWPRVVQYPSLDELRCLYPTGVAGGVLLLEPTADEGYLRDWSVGGGMPPERHFGYAAQWYAFAATLLFFFIKLNIHRKP